MLWMKKQHYQIGKKCIFHAKHIRPRQWLSSIGNEWLIDWTRYHNRDEKNIYSMFFIIQHTYNAIVKDTSSRFWDIFCHHLTSDLINKPGFSFYNSRPTVNEVQNTTFLIFLIQFICNRRYKWLNQLTHNESNKMGRWTIECWLSIDPHLASTKKGVPRARCSRLLNNFASISRQTQVEIRRCNKFFAILHELADV